MINNILVYVAILFISWFTFLCLICIGVEAIDYIQKTWSNYGK